MNGPRRPGPGPAVQLALLGQTIISAGTYLVAKRGLGSLSPFTLVVWRFIVSALVFVALLLARPGRALPPRAALPRILWFGFLVGPLNQLLFFVGLRATTPAHAALLYALTPLGVYAVSVARGRERLTGRATLGLCLALLGVIVLLLGRGLQALGGAFAGDLIILVAVSAWVLYTADGKGLVQEHGFWNATAWTLIAGALLLLPLMPFEARVGEVLRSGPPVLLSIVYLGVLTSVVSYLLWYFALSRARASQVAVFANLQPVFTALAAWWLLGERVTWALFAGGVLVLCGVALTEEGEHAEAESALPAGER